MWYIGQEIVCVKTHSEGVVTENSTYIIKGISGCECGTCLDVGVRDYEMGCMVCFDCGYKHYTGAICWLSDELFAPLDSLMKEEIEELMKVETVFGINVNDLK